MTALTNDALLEILSEDGWPQSDDIFIAAGAGTTQAAGLPVKGSLHRIVTNGGGATAALTMKSVKSFEAPSMVWILNDSPTAVVVFCALGDSMNGSANGSLTIPATTAAVFARVPAQIKRKGGSSGGGTLDWRASTIA